ncbi:MAG: hypothetical protein H8D94_00065 [Candidatus Pelagibacter sp.]|nr:hypothetical protein [Candidatus Pelagibacter sp.]
MFEVLIIKSNNSCMDVDGTIYPMNKDTTPNKDKPTHLQDITDEWWDSLSTNDLDRVNRYLGLE